MTIHERIRHRRKECGLSADAVAEQLGVSRATIYRYESAEINNMGIDKIEPLARVLRTTPEYLMGWTDQPIKRKSALIISNRIAPSEMELQDLPRNLQKRCSELNLSFNFLAARTGINESILQEYAKGEFKHLTPTRLESLAESLNISINELLGWHELGHGIDNSYGALYDLLSYLGYEYETTQTPQSEIDEYLSQGYELIDDGVSEIDRIRSRKTNACYQVKPEQLTEMMTDLNKYMEFLIQKLISQCPEIDADDGRTYYRVRDYPDD